MMIPPNNIEAEQAVIAIIMYAREKDAIFKIIDILTPEDFSDRANKKIFAVILDLFNKGEGVDSITVKNALESRGELGEVGGINYLLKTLETPHFSNHIENYARIIIDKSLRRQLLNAQTINESVIYDEEREINSVIVETQNNIFQVNPTKKNKVGVRDILLDLSSMQEEYKQKYENGKKILGLSTGIQNIDSATEGIMPGNFWIIGGWHGTGKTSFALNIIHSLLEQTIPCSIISLEMSPVQILSKMMGIRHRVSSMKILKGNLDKELSENIQEAKYFFEQSPLTIHTEFDIQKIKMIIHKEVYLRNTKVILIDYLQKISSEKVWEETPLLSLASKELANIAQKLGVSIICISQISNEAKKGNGAGAGFKGSGTIEASADLAIVIRRNKQEEKPEDSIIPVIIDMTKNKYGFDGIIEYYMELSSGKFLSNPLGIDL